MKFRRPTMLLAEVKESCTMALGAIASHKLRSVLTLLGVLVGVFSIIVTMTAMRVLKSNIETQMSQLGSQTFAIRKWPAVHFGGPGGFEKYFRRKNILLDQGKIVREKVTLDQHVGLEG